MFGCKHNDTVDLSQDLVFVCMKPGVGRTAIGYDSIVEGEGALSSLFRLSCKLYLEIPNGGEV